MESKGSKNKKEEGAVSMTTHKLATFQYSREFHHQGTLKDSISDVICGQDCTVAGLPEHRCYKLDTIVTNVTGNET
jgi:hypothetical protein